MEWGFHKHGFDAISNAGSRVHGDTIQLGPRGFQKVGDISENTVSSRCRSLLDEHHVRASYRAVKILDRLGQLISPDHWLFDPLDEVDCLDIEASEVSRYGPGGGVRVDRLARREDFAPGDQIAGAKRIVIREDAIPEGLHVFRLVFHHPCILISRALAERLVSELTGIEFHATTVLRRE